MPEDVTRWVTMFGPWIGLALFVIYGGWRGIKKLVILGANWARPFLERLVTAHSELVESLKVTTAKQAETAVRIEATVAAQEACLEQQTELVKAIATRIEQHDADMSDRVKKIQTEHGCKYVPVTHGPVPKSKK